MCEKAYRPPALLGYLTRRPSYAYHMNSRTILHHMGEKVDDEIPNRKLISNFLDHTVLCNLDSVCLHKRLATVYVLCRSDNIKSRRFVDEIGGDER